MLDRYDKDILRLLLIYKDRYLTTNQIAVKINVSPLTAKRHLEKLFINMYVIFRKEGKVRRYTSEKEGKLISAQSKISWKLNYRQDRIINSSIKSKRILKKGNLEEVKKKAQEEDVY